MQPTAPPADVNIINMMVMKAVGYSLLLQTTGHMNGKGQNRALRGQLNLTFVCNCKPFGHLREAYGLGR